MKCHEFHSLLSMMLSHELDDTRQRCCEQHVRECPGCQLKHAEMKHTVLRIRSLSANDEGLADKALGDFEDRLMTRPL